MAEKDYDTWLAEAKAALDGYSAEQEAIAKLYEQAKQNAAASYDAQKKQLAVQTEQSKNQAAADIKRTERNIGQTLASRGLAFSGENAQTHLDLNLSLQNRLSALERDAAEQSQTLEQEKAKALTELDLAHAEARSTSAGKRAELQNQLANIASQKASSQTVEIPEKNTETSTESGNKGESKPPNKLTSLKGKTLGERFKQMLEYVANEKGTPKDETAYIPNISARDLAKQLISSAGGNGSVSGYEQQETLALLLDALSAEHDLDATYYDELLLNLRSMGYRPDYTGMVDREIKAVCKESNAVYTDYYDRYYKMYDMIGHLPAECDQMAGELAVFKQLAYVYERCESIDRFEVAVESMGMEDELDTFYQKIKVSGDQYKLGSEIDRR